MPDTNIVRLIREQANIVEVVSAMSGLSLREKVTKPFAPSTKKQTRPFMSAQRRGSGTVSVATLEEMSLTSSSALKG